MSSSLSTAQRSHRRTSIRIPAPRHQHRHPSPPPPSKQSRVTSRSAWPRHPSPSSDTGNYTLARPTHDHRGREIRSEIWEPDREDEYIALYGQRNHESYSPRRPRARTVSTSPEIDSRSSRARVRTGSLSASPLDHPQLRQPCPAVAASSRAWLPPTSRKHERRKQQTHRRHMEVVRRDSGYESDDADEDTSNEESIHYAYAGRCDSPARMLTHASPATPPSGRFAVHSNLGQTSLLRPDSPSNESSASTDDDWTPANADPHALEYYLGNDDTWRDAEIYSQSSEESALSDNDEMISRPFNGSHYPDDKLFTAGSSQPPSYSDMGSYSYTHSHRRQRRTDKAPHLPKRLPLVPSCSNSRKRASMRAAWKMRFGRLFESDSEAGTEVEDELDWEGYESADARRIVAIRIHKAGGGDGRKVMQGKEQLAELLVKKPIDHRRLAGRVPRRRRADTVRGRERADTAATVQPSLTIETCPTCTTSVLSPSVSTKTMTTASAESPASTTSGTLPTPASSPPTSVPNTPCPSCAQLSPRGDALGLTYSPPTRSRVLSPRSPPCKSTPLHAGTDPLTVFAVTVEQEKQRDFSGLLKRSAPPPESMFTGLMRGVKSIFGRINNLVDLAATTPLTTVDGTCPLSPVMGGTISREISTRRRSASVPAISSTHTRSRSQRRRSYLRPPQVALPGAPTSPYGYRVRPQEVSAAFPALVASDERMGNVAGTPVPSDQVPQQDAESAVELKDVPPRVEADTPAPVVPQIDLKEPIADSTDVRRRRASRSPSRRRTSAKRATKANSSAGREKSPRLVELEANRDEITRSRAVVDSKYWRVLAGEMEQRRRGGVEVAFMVRLAVEEGRNLPIFTSEEQQAATGEIVVGGVWKASLARWRVGGVGNGPTRIRSGLVNETFMQSEASDIVSDSSSSL